jgi:hypothetical protein
MHRLLPPRPEGVAQIGPPHLSELSQQEVIDEFRALNVTLVLAEITGGIEQVPKAVLSRQHDLGNELAIRNSHQNQQIFRATVPKLLKALGAAKVFFP